MTKTVKKLLWATYFLALIPLIVGLGIFFSWWIGKALFLVTLDTLEAYGFFWILISLPVAFAGLVTGSICIYKTFRSGVRPGVVAILCVLINIPAVAWVLWMQSDIEQRAYVRIHNQTGVDFEELRIGNSNSISEFSGLRNDDGKTRYFYPKDIGENFKSERLVDSVTLVIKIGDDQKIVGVPAIYKGECVRIVVDKYFKVAISR